MVARLAVVHAADISPVPLMLSKHKIITQKSQFQNLAGTQHLRQCKYVVCMCIEFWTLLRAAHALKKCLPLVNAV